jgi:hypothetical protein
VPEQLRPFYYAQVIGAILHYMRDPHRDRRRKTVLQIDEFGYLAQTESLAQLAATICKVARKYGLGLIAIDQNPGTPSWTAPTVASSLRMRRPRYCSTWTTCQRGRSARRSQI